MIPILNILNYPINVWNTTLKNYLINISNKLKDNFKVFFESLSLDRKSVV